MFSSNLTHRNNQWTNCSFSKEEFEEDSTEDSEAKKENSIEEEDEVVN